MLEQCQYNSCTYIYIYIHVWSWWLEEVTQGCGIWRDIEFLHLSSSELGPLVSSPAASYMTFNMGRSNMAVPAFLVWSHSKSATNYVRGILSFPINAPLYFPILDCSWRYRGFQDLATSCVNRHIDDQSAHVQN